MIKIKHRALIIVLFFFFSIHAFPGESPAPKKGGNGNRLYFGPVVGFYSINKKHAINPSQKMSATFGFKRELNVGRDYKVFFLIGVDYFFHGLNFRSYYFRPDTLQVYDKSFGYNYSLFIHELNLPLQFKYLFKREDNSLFSPYVSFAYHLRYLLPGNLKITENGNKIKDDSPDVKFKNPLIIDKLNAFVSIGLGWQKNSLTSSKGSFFVELNYRYGFSAYYFETDYAPSSLYINSTHLSILLGLKF
jgi:hypothetical protein